MGGLLLRCVLLLLSCPLSVAPDGHECDKVYLGQEIGWAEIYDYSDEDKDCKLSMDELKKVCDVHFNTCLKFLESTHKTKDGKVCGATEMKAKMDKGGDVCCQYSNGKLCATIPIGSGPAATDNFERPESNVAWECADETGDLKGKVRIGSTAAKGHSPQIGMPTPSRVCKKSIVGLRFPNVDIPKNSVIDAAYLLFAVEQRGQQNGEVRLEITVENSNNAAPFTQIPKLLSSRTSTNTLNYWRNVPKWGPKADTGLYEKTAMSMDINAQVSQLFARHDWVPGNAIVVMIKQGEDSFEAYAQRIAKAWDPDLVMPALRITYHTDDTISSSITAYHAKVAQEEGWSTFQILLFVLISGVVVGVGCHKYNKKYGRTRNKKYRTVVGDDEERAFAEQDDFSEEEYDTSKKKRNPVSGGQVDSEGVPAGMQTSNIVYHDSRGDQHQRGGGHR